MRGTLTFAWVIVVLFLPVLAVALADRGTLTGTVIDQGGAVVPGARVLARNPLTGAQFETVSTSTGNFSLPQMPSGE